MFNKTGWRKAWIFSEFLKLLSNVYFFNYQIVTFLKRVTTPNRSVSEAPEIQILTETSMDIQNKSSILLPHNKNIIVDIVSTYYMPGTHSVLVNNPIWVLSSKEVEATQMSVNG